MNIFGISTNLFGWSEKYKTEGKAWNLEQVFRECEESGFNAVEGVPTRETLKALKGTSLRISSGYVGIELHKPMEELRLESVRSAAKLLSAAGARDLIVNADPKGSWTNPELKTEDELKRQGENLSFIAELARNYGLRTSFHNHAETYPLCMGDLRSVIEYASDDVLLCVDTAWAHASGINPVEWIRKYHDRIGSLHLRNAFGSVPAEDLLEGDLSIPEIVAALDEISYEGWLTLELWHREDTHAVRSMKEDSQRSIELLRQCISRSRNFG